MAARQLILRLAALAALSLLVGGACVPGCAEFKGQTLVLRHDEARDTLDLLLIDRGLVATGGDIERAVAQLQAARGRRVFAVFSTMLTFDLDGALAPLDAERAPWSQMREALREAEVRDLGSWVDGDGNLCAAQHVRVPHVAAALRRLNAGLVAWLLGDARGLQELAQGCGLEEPGDVEALRAALARQQDSQFVQLRRSALAFSLPMDDALWRRTQAFALHSLSDLESRALAGEADARATRELLLALDTALLREGDLVTLQLGNAGRAELRVEVPLRGVEGADLAGPLREVGWTIGGPDGEAAARAVFDAATAVR